MARIIREEQDGLKKAIIYACTGCGTEVTLNHKIGDRNTFCGKCMKDKKAGQWDRYWEKAGREKERKHIIEMIKEIQHCRLYCMADMCPAKDASEADCGKCALDWVLKRLKDGDN